MNISKQENGLPRYHKLSKLKLGQIQARGWLKDQLLRSAAGMGGNLDHLEPDMIADPFINYSRFKRLPSSNEDLDPTFCAGWSSEISGTYWTGLVQLAYTLNDKELMQKAGKWVDGVLKHQEADGYLGGYPVSTDRKADYNAWGSNWCYRALLSFYEATGREDVLAAVHRGLLWFCQNWRSHKTDYAAPTIIESMIVVYFYTGDKRLVTFCEDYLVWLETNTRWQNSVSRLLADSLPYNSMHVVAYGENVKHPALVYCATGDRRLLDASVKGVDKAVRRIIQATGGPSSCSEFLSPVGATQETEYCNFSTYQQTYSWLSLITGETKYGDYMEQVLFNGAQGARKKDERAIAYFSAPNQALATRSSSIYAKDDKQVYAPCFFVACCPAQSVRTVPEYVRGMCLTDQDDNIYMLAYGPASVTSRKAVFTIDTLYPFRDTIHITIKQAANAVFHFRIPDWCDNPELYVNGIKAAFTQAAGGYVKLAENPQTGDQIKLVFPMKIKVNKIDDRASAAKYPISICRGPIVFALHISEKWVAYEGRPITPLPEDWSWYEAFPEDAGQDWPGQKSWYRSIDEKLDADKIVVRELPENGYVWENPPVVLDVPLYKSDFCYSPPAARTYDPWECPVEINGEAEMHELIPFGCTSLRITYFPRAKTAG